MRVYKYQLKHDSADRIVEKLEAVAGKTVAWKYTYDSKGRLAEAYLDGRMVCQCRYDNKGRRTQDYFPRMIGTRVRNYRYTMDSRLESAGNNGYTHDKQGFRSIWNSGGRYTLYEYAPDYRLLAVEVEGEDARFTFIHDENGQRAAKLFKGEPVEAYRWLDFTRLAGFHDGRNGHELFYDEDARTPFAMRRDDGGLYYLHYDQVGSLRVVANRSGNVIKEILYDPFGGVIEDTNPDFRVPIGFAGGLHDRDLGFVRFGWRDYDTFTGRWTAPDPMGDAGGDDDWYGYCLDDPVNGVDPLGLFVLGGAGIATAAMGATGLLQYAPQINQWGMALTKELMDGSPGFFELPEFYGDIVKNNLARMKREREEYYARKQRQKEKEEEKQKAEEQERSLERMKGLEERYERAKNRRQHRGWEDAGNNDEDPGSVERMTDLENQYEEAKSRRQGTGWGSRASGQSSGGSSGSGGSGNIGSRGGSYNGYGR